MKPAGLYIHVPFCLSKCRYCSFYSIDSADLDHAVPQFISALLQEMTLYRDFPAFDTVYIGGGTPTLLRPEHIEKIIAAARRHFTILPGTEWSIEANPGDLNVSYLKALFEIGLNRITIGAQSLDDSLLQWLGRRHTRRDVFDTLEQARLAGFNNIGIDIIYCIPGQSIHSFIHHLNEIAAYHPEHLSCYQLSIEPGTPLYKDHHRGVFQKATEDVEVEFFEQTSETLQGQGYLHYEISNFADGEANCSRHNMKYWNHFPYLGLGPAAHSFREGRRWWNVRSVDRYIAALGKSHSPIENSESLSSDELRLETIALRLRTAAGLDLSVFNLMLEDGKASPKTIEEIRQLCREGLVSINDNYVIPSLKGFALSDALALRIEKIIADSDEKPLYSV